jgi:uroporphyrinogen decarboxylase
MTPLERIGLTLSGQFADHRPVAAVLSLYGCRMTGSTPFAYYRDPALYLAGQKAVVHAFNPDIVFAPFALPLEAESVGAKLSWTDNAPPNVRKPLAPPAGGAAELAWSNPEKSDSLSFLVESARLLAREFSGERPVAAILTAPSDLPAIILGIDAWLNLLLFEQDSALEYLHFAEEHFVSMA